MDYIIFGLGLGATLTLVGWAFREWGAGLRDRSSSPEQTVLSGYELVNRMAWQRFCRSCGSVLAIFGLLVLLSTIVATALMLSNATGATIVLATASVCVVATLVWLGVYLHRFGARGILRPKVAKPTPPLSVSKPGLDLPGPAKSSVPVVGPPVPAGSASMAAGHSQRPGGTAHQDDVASADAGPMDESRVASEEETGGLVEHVPADDEPRVAGPVFTFDDDPDDPVGEDEVIAVPEPATGKRRIVMLTEKDDDEEDTRSARDDTPTDDAGAADGDTGSDADRENEHERRPELEDVSPSSGRADAVRKLRQRRIRRLTRDSSAPD